MKLTVTMITKVLPAALDAANTLAVQMGDSPEGVNSFGPHCAYNATGDASKPVEAYIIRNYVYPPTPGYTDKYAEVQAAVKDVVGISVSKNNWDDAVGELLLVGIQ